MSTVKPRFKWRGQSRFTSHETVFQGEIFFLPVGARAMPGHIFEPIGVDPGCPFHWNWGQNVFLTPTWVKSERWLLRPY